MKQTDCTLQTDGSMVWYHTPSQLEQQMQLLKICPKRLGVRSTIRLCYIIGMVGYGWCVWYGTITIACALVDYNC